MKSQRNKRKLRELLVREGRGGRVATPLPLDPTLSTKHYEIMKSPKVPSPVLTCKLIIL